MKLKILNEELEYVVQEIGIIDGKHFAVIALESYEKDELHSTDGTRKILRRSDQTFLIPISKKTFEELRVKDKDLK